MIVLDASVVIALLAPGDSNHDIAFSLLADHSGGGFVMHQLTLAEVLVGAVREGRGAELLYDLTAAGIRAAEPAQDDSLLLAELRATTGLRMPDCCVLVVGLRSSAPIATFDARLASAARKRGIDVLPDAS